MFSNKSALESLALIPLQGPLKTMLQISVVPLINNRLYQQLEKNRLLSNELRMALNED